MVTATPLTNPIIIDSLTWPDWLPVAVVAVLIALTLDALVGEFPERVHPVALLGRVIAPLDREWEQPKLVGLAAAVVVPLGFAGVLGGLTAGALLVGPAAGALVAGLVLFSTVSLRRLLSAASEVVGTAEHDIERARTEVRALVGRPPEELSPAQLRSAATESLAENLADGFVAPLGAFLVGGVVSLPVAAGCAAWVKGVNTLDSMLGYTSKPVGRASARLDDAVMWLPARCSAVLIAVAAGDPYALVRARQWAHRPSSPNSGWPMATLAVALDARLDKPDSYTLNPETALPNERQARRGIRIVGTAGVLAVVAVVTLLGVNARC
jgi:adenosylcobinamide-phosphate synthase